MAKHTPGPWLITGEDECTVYALHHNGDFKNGKPFFVNRFYTRVEDCRDQGGTPDEARANARLIAAAPDLLEALEVTVAIIEDYLTDLSQPLDHVLATMDSCRAAIAKATA